MNKVIQTSSGLFVRKEPEMGVLVYSPYSGLVYACDESQSENTFLWLNGETKSAPSDEYKMALGAGWLIDPKEAVYPIPHILPAQSKYWTTNIPFIKKPIVINWLITGNCPLNCAYCYAEDLMRGKCREPEDQDICEIAKTILTYNPLVVVLTGGDPLSSPHLERAIELLHNRVGLIVDTSAAIFDKAHLSLFKKYGVFVRISLDSEIPSINDKLRPYYRLAKKGKSISKSTVEAALNAICLCVESNVKVAVQSVATKINRHDFVALGDKLYNIGVGGWRILMIQPSKSKYDAFLKLRGGSISQKRFYNHILKSLSIKCRNDWHGNLPIQVVQNNIPNAIVLVAPDGAFLTELNIQTADSCGGKVIIDKKYPKKPRMESIHYSVNMHAHVERYLNLTNTFSSF